MNSDTAYANSRRDFLQASGALGLALAALPGGRCSRAESEGKSGHGFDRMDTAVVFIDPQNEVLSDKGAAWAVVGQSVRDNKTVENMERIFQAAYAYEQATEWHTRVPAL